MTILTSTGFGDSGSSVITDLLQEYPIIDAKPCSWECTFLHEPFGIKDLESAVLEGHRLKVDAAMERFLQLSKKLSTDVNYKQYFNGKFYEISKRFIDNVCSIKWNGWWHGKNLDICGYKHKKLINCATGYFYKMSTQPDSYEPDGWTPMYHPYSDMRYINDLDLERFYQYAKTYLCELLKELNCKNDYLYLDQLLPPISTDAYFRFFSQCIKVFIVDKDPRDLYLNNNLFAGSRYIPSHDINVFIEWYRKTRLKVVLNNNVMYCRFDDLINDYDNQCDRIEKFIGVKNNDHILKGHFFLPELSKQNLGLYRKYSNYSEEIKIIERELVEFLSDSNSNSKFEMAEYKKPIFSIISNADLIQNGCLKHRNFLSRIKISYFGTDLLLQIKFFKRRKTVFQKLKGIVFISFGIIKFLPDIIINFCII